MSARMSSVTGTPERQVQRQCGLPHPLNDRLAGHPPRAALPESRRHCSQTCAASRNLPDRGQASPNKRWAGCHSADPVAPPATALPPPPRIVRRRAAHDRTPDARAAAAGWLGNRLLRGLTSGVGIARHRAAGPPHREGSAGPRRRSPPWRGVADPPAGRCPPWPGRRASGPPRTPGGRARRPSPEPSVHRR